VIPLATDAPVSPAHLARLLGVTPRYIRKLIANGVLEAVRLPNAGASGRAHLGRWRIPPSAFHPLLARLKAE